MYKLYTSVLNKGYTIKNNKIYTVMRFSIMSINARLGKEPFGKKWNSMNI